MRQYLRIKKTEKPSVLIAPMGLYVWEEDAEGIISGFFPDGKIRHEVKNSTHFTGGYWGSTGFVPSRIVTKKQTVIQLDDCLFYNEADAVDSLLRKGFGLEDACLLIEGLPVLN